MQLGQGPLPPPLSDAHNYINCKMQTTLRIYALSRNGHWTASSRSDTPILLYVVLDQSNASTWHTYFYIDQWFLNGGTRAPWCMEKCSKGHTNF